MGKTFLIYFYNIFLFAIWKFGLLSWKYFVVQVFDLQDVKPNEFVRYGLKCLEMLADLGDSCARETREKMRVMVCSLVHINMKLIFAYWSAVNYSAAFPPSTYKEMIIVAFGECAKLYSCPM